MSRDSTPTNDTPVTYTGRETPFTDRLYGSRLTFEPGQTRSLPSQLAERLLRHADVFERGTAAAPAPAGKSPSPLKNESPKTDKPLDDTRATLEQSAKEQAAREATLNQRQNLVDAVNAMDKDALKSFAQEKYGQPLTKTLSVENMRAKVVGLIDQFGMV